MKDRQIQALADAVLGRIFVPLEASARHVHLTEAQCQALFGSELLPDRPLSQPGQYLSKQRVSIIGPKGRFDRVAVLGPARKNAQVEISMTDSRSLGITAPIRQSGDTEESPGIILEGLNGRISIQSGVIIAQRHLHLTPEDAQRFAVADRQVVRLQVFTERPLIFQDVLVRVRPDFATRAHLDFDEANACAMQPGDLGRILP
jgi:propanediol utilization protein